MGRFSIIGGILQVVTYGLLLLLLIVYISPLISPEKSAFLSLVGLGAPFIFLLSFLITIYWIIRWERIAIACVAALLIGIGYSARLVQFPVLKRYDSTGQILKVVSYNAHFFTTSQHRDVITSTLNCLDTLNAGVICFQEFATSAQDNIPEINRRLSEFPHRYLHKTKNPSSKIDYYTAIYSKYKIVNRGTVKFGKYIHSSIYADIIYRNDTIRVFNNHLQSNNVNTSDVKFLSGEGEPLMTENSIFRIFSIGKKVAQNSSTRAIQSDSISSVIRRTPYSVIVCGDHNVTPVSYTYNKVRGKLHDAFMERGSWYGYTYKGFFNLLRIDYLFHSNKFETISYSSPNILWSDHKPIVVELKYTK